MPAAISGDRKTCSDDCGKKLAAARGRSPVNASEMNAAKAMTPAMREFRELMDKDDDYVRELLQEVVRDSVTQVVRDNVVGAAEVITGLLPKALAGIAKDLDSKDWSIRKSARDAVLKYAMMFKDKEGDDNDLGTIQVVHNVNLPDTPLGHEVLEQIETPELEAQVEAFEEGWPVCVRCGERKHPDAMRYKTAVGAAMCSSCHLSARYRINREDEVDGV